MIFLLTALFIGAEWVPNSGEEFREVVLESFSYWLVVGQQGFNWSSIVQGSCVAFGLSIDRVSSGSYCFMFRTPQDLTHFFKLLRCIVGFLRSL